MLTRFFPFFEKKLKTSQNFFKPQPKQEREVRKQVTLGKKMLPLRLALALQAKREKAVSSLTGSFSSSSSGSGSSSSSSSSSPSSETSLSATAVLEAPPRTAVKPPRPSSPIPGAVEIPRGGGKAALPPPLQEKKKPKTTFLPREKQLERSRDDTDDEVEEKSSSPSSLADRRQRSGLAPGALDPSNPLGRRAKELAGRRAYLKNFWYAVALSEEVKNDGKPHGVTALGRRLALFRDEGDEGRVKAVSDVCPHRGAPLHRGWVTDGVAGAKGHSCVVCPYHGWAFDGEGVLRDVPAAEHPDEWPRKQLVESYPIEEKGGFVWLFYGKERRGGLKRVGVFFFFFSFVARCFFYFLFYFLLLSPLPLFPSFPPNSPPPLCLPFFLFRTTPTKKTSSTKKGSPDLPEGERPPIPFVPELEDPKWKAVYGSIEMGCEHHDVFQNAIDVAHIHYLVRIGGREKEEREGVFFEKERKKTSTRARKKNPTSKKKTHFFLSNPPPPQQNSTPTPSATRTSPRSATCTSRRTPTAPRPPSLFTTSPSTPCGPGARCPRSTSRRAQCCRRRR